MTNPRYQLEQILEYFPDGVFTLDPQLLISYVNPAFCQMLGFSSEELIGKSISEYLGDLTILDSCHAEVTAHGFCRDQETIFKRKDGSIIHISKNVQMLQDEQGYAGLIVSIRDLTQVHELNKKLAESAKLLARYNDNLSALVLRRTQSLNEQMAFLGDYKKAIDASSMVSKCDLNHTIIEVNQALCQRSGYDAAEIIGKKCSLLWADDSVGLLPEITSRIHRGLSWKGIIKLISKSGKPFYLESTIVPISDETGRLREFVKISNDVTPLIETTEALTERLLYDTLTRLPNRVKLLSDTEKADGKTRIVLFNIDSFNELNTFYGHFLADRLLKTIAHHLQQLIADIPFASVYKLPVDEFAVVIADNWSDERLESFVQSTLDKVSAHNFIIDHQQINVTLTAGIASSDRVGENPRDVLVATDMALKMAKKQHKSFVFYDPKLKIKQGYEKNLQWVKRLRTALEEDRLVPFFQPIVNAHTLEIDRYECLVRIVEPDGEVINPFFFLDVAKKLKLYHQLTMTMIEKSFKKFADSPYSFAINLSIEDIVDAKVSAWILQKVRDCAFADRVIFEIVESEGIQNYDEVNRFIKEVKRFGVKIAIDDFGAGYSNFVYIMRLDIDFIKIDGSIIRDIHQSRSSQVITETIIDFARKLNIQTVAEFVADENVYNYLKALPLDSLQGYLFGEPKADLV